MMCIFFHLFLVYLSYMVRTMDLDPTHQYIVQQQTRTLGVLTVVLAIIRWRRHVKKKRRLRKYGPLVDRDLVKKTRLDDLYNGSDTDCINQLRMRKAVFWKLASYLRDNGILCDTIHVLVEEQLAMFLHTVGHNLRNRVIGFFVKRSGKTVGWYFNEVLRAICYLAKDMIKLRSVDTHSKIVILDGSTHILRYIVLNIFNI